MTRPLTLLCALLIATPSMAQTPQSDPAESEPLPPVRPGDVAAPSSPQEEADEEGQEADEEGEGSSQEDQEPPTVEEDDESVREESPRRRRAQERSDDDGDATSQAGQGDQGLAIQELDTVSGSGYNARANVNIHFEEGSTSTLDASYRYVWRSVSPGKSKSADYKISYESTTTDSTDEFGDSSTNSSATLTLSGTAGPSGDHASLTFDKYVGNAFNRPSFIFFEPQIRFQDVSTESGDTTAAEDPDAIFSVASTVGFGLGRVYPSASYERANSILKILRREGALLRRESPNDLLKLMKLLQHRWDATKEVLEAIEYLKSAGLVGSQGATSSMITEMVAAVEQSFDYKETGAEYRLGVNYNFITGDTESDSDPLLLAGSYTQVFGDERLIVQPSAYFYKRLDEDIDASYGAALDIRYAKTPRAEWFFTDRFSPDVNNSIELGYRYTLASFMSAEIKYTLDIPLNEAEEDPLTGETPDEVWPAGIFVSLNAGGRGL